MYNGINRDGNVTAGLCRSNIDGISFGNQHENTSLLWLLQRKGDIRSGAVLEGIDKFKYLGSIIDESAGCSHRNQHVYRSRKISTVITHNRWKDRTLGKQMKLKLLKTP